MTFILRSVNRTILAGKAICDADLYPINSGKDVSGLRLALGSMVNGQETNQSHTMICWDTLAETAGAYARKGEPLYIEGRLEYHTFQDEEGKVH